MNPKRMHKLFSSAAVTTALSLSVASLGGCASFDPNPAAAGQAPVTPAGTQPTGNQGSQTAVTPAKAMTTMTGVADLAGKAVANAPVQVFDAFTGKPVAGLVAAGAGNLVAAGAGNYDLAQAGGLKTDAEGKFAFSLPEIGEDAMLKVVVMTPEGMPLSALVGGSELDKSAGYKLKAFAKAIKKKTDFNFKVNIPSTVVTTTVSPMIKLVAETRTQTRSGIRPVAVANLLSTADDLEFAFIEKWESYTYEQQYTFYNLVLEDTTTTTESELNFSTLERAFTKAGMADAFTSTGFTSVVSKALTDTLAAAQENGGLKGTSLTFTKDDFPTALQINLDNLEDGTITFTDPNGTEVEVVVDVIEEDSFENLPDTFGNKSEFLPTVAISYNENAGDTAPLAMTVTQPSGNNDVETIIAKISRKWIKSIDLDAAATINDPASTSVGGNWGDFAATTGHIVTATSASNTSFLGNWTDGSGVDIATVDIDVDDDFVTIEFEFNMTGNNAVKTSGGSARLEALKSVIELDAAAIKAHNKQFPDGNNIVDITLISRSTADAGASAVDTAVERANNYGRPITIVNNP